MKARFELGEMDENVEWDNIPYSVVDSREHRESGSLRWLREHGAVAE